MVKEYDYVNQNAALSIARDGLFFDGTRYWGVFIEAGSNTTLKYCTTMTGVWTSTTVTVAQALGVEYSVAFWLDGTILYGAFGSWINSFHKAFYIDISTLAITDVTYATLLIPLQIVDVGGAMFCHVYDSVAAKYGMWDFGAGFVYDTGEYHYGKGYVESDIFNCLCSTAEPVANGDPWKIRSFNGIAWAAVATYDTAANITIGDDYLFKIGTTLVRISALGYLFMKVATASVFIEENIGHKPVIAYYLDSGVATVRYVYFKNKVLQPNGNHYILLEPATRFTSANDYCYSAWDGYLTMFNTNSGIYSSYLFSLATSTRIKIAANKEVLGRACPTISVVSSDEPITGQWVSLYDDNDVLELRGIISKYDYDFEKYNCTVEKPSEYDLDLAIDYDPTTKHGDAIIKDIIDTKCTYLTYTGTSITDPASSKTYAKWNNTTIRKIFTEIAKTEGYIWTVHPNFDVYFNQGRDSSVTITDASDGVVYLGRNPVRKIPQARSHILLEGKWNVTTGKRDSVEDFPDPSAALYYDQFPNADVTQLTSILAGLRNLVNLTYTQAYFKVYNKSLRVGDYFTLTLTDYSISADTYYVIEITKDIVSNELYLSCTSALIIPKTDKEAETEERIVNIEENVDAVNVRTDAVKTTADAAMPKAGGIFTGDVHVDGYDCYLGAEANTLKNLFFRRNAATVGGMNSYGSLLGIFGGTGTSAGVITVSYDQTISHITISNTVYPIYNFSRYRASSAAVQSGDILGRMIFNGSDGSGLRVGAEIRSYVTAAVGSSDMPADIRLYTTPDGSATALEVLRLNTAVASAVSYVGITNGTAASGVWIKAEGTATDLYLQAGGGKDVMCEDNFNPATDNTYYLGKNDDDSPKAWKGVILKDTTNGKYYRIEIINGTITATDLTD